MRGSAVLGYVSQALAAGEREESNLISLQITSSLLTCGLGVAPPLPALLSAGWSAAAEGGGRDRGH